jgi:hypothetical protein
MVISIRMKSGLSAGGSNDGLVEGERVSNEDPVEGERVSDGGQAVPP